MPPDTPQVELWSHFQTVRPEAFRGAAKRLDSLIRLAEKHSHGRSLLNIGCGDGYLERSAQQRNWSVVSVDPDAKSVAALKARGIDARCGRIESLPVESDSLDVVLCTEVLEHLTPESLEAGLAEIRRVLKPAGLLIGTVPYRENLVENEVFCPDCRKTFHRWGHHQSFDEARLASLLGTHFEVRSVRPRYFPTWSMYNWKARLLWSARYAFALFGNYGRDANLLFMAAKRG